MTQKCACVILNYNDSDTTRKIVYRVNDYNVFYKIIIVDNCSKDNSYNSLLDLCNERIICIKTNKNGGYGYGNNYGIRYAHDVLGCRYVALCNPDVYFTEKYINNCLDFIQNHDYACVAGKQLDIFGKQIPDCAWKIPTAFEYAVMGTKVESVFSCNYRKEELVGDFASVDCLPGAMLVFDAYKFLSVGGYDENMFLYCEETLIAIRLKKAGFKTGILLNETYRHEHSVSINKEIESRERQMQMIFQSRNYLMKTYLHANAFNMILAGICQKHILRKMRRVR